MKILIAEPEDFSTEALKILSSFGSVTCQNISQNEIGKTLTDYDIVWIRLGLTIRASNIPQHPRCQIIVSGTTGLNHLDVNDLNLAGIKVLSLQGQTKFLESITATAEHTLALLLSLVRIIPAAHGSVLSGKWDRDSFKGHEVSGKTIGIIGYGRLGKIVANYCHALQMRILVYDPFVPDIEKRYKQVTSMEYLLGNIDYLTLHIPLNQETKKIADNNFFSLLRQGAYLINTSRGELIDENALLSVLENGKLAGAALDVLCDEEFFVQENRLVQYARKHNNLLLTPHVGGCTWESMSKCELFMAEMLLKKLGKQ